MQLQIVENDNKIKNIALIGIEDYLEEIYMNLLLEERNNIIKPKSEYMMNQIDVNELMRATLIDWIIEIHYSFKFTQETLFTTIWLIDTYLSFELFNRQQFQLLGITCFLISSSIMKLFILMDIYSRNWPKMYAQKLKLQKWKIL